MDKSGDRVHLMFLEFLRNFRDPPQYSWGSGCLTRLYRELCRESHKDHSQIGGVLQLVQYWAWAKLLFLCPKIEPPIQKKSFHYTFKGHELHTHFITIHSKGMSKSLISLHTHFITIHSKGMNYIPISLQFIWRAWVSHSFYYIPISLQFIHYPFRTQNNDEYSQNPCKIMMKIRA